LPDIAEHCRNARQAVLTFRTVGVSRPRRCLFQQEDKMEQPSSLYRRVVALLKRNGLR
jgi:hypothetical protein